jgi:hypothetical protein
VHQLLGNFTKHDLLKHTQNLAEKYAKALICYAASPNQYPKTCFCLQHKASHTKVITASFTLVFISAYTCIDEDHNTKPYEGTIRCRLQKGILHYSAHTAERKWQTANKLDLLAQFQSAYLHFNQDLKKKAYWPVSCASQKQSTYSKLKQWLIFRHYTSPECQRRQPHQSQ